MDEGSLRRLSAGLGLAHDRLSSLTFAGAQLCLLAIVFAYSYETIARYFFNAPTSWSNEVVAYALCVGVFLALPEVTRVGGHIAITSIYDVLPGNVRARAGVALALASAAVCFFVAWICLETALQHVARGSMTIGVTPIPKAWLSLWLPYGFASAGLHFVRHAATPHNAVDAAQNAITSQDT